MYLAHVFIYLKANSFIWKQTTSYCRRVCFHGKFFGHLLLITYSFPVNESNTQTLTYFFARARLFWSFKELEWSQPSYREYKQLARTANHAPTNLSLAALDEPKPNHN